MAMLVRLTIGYEKLHWPIAIDDIEFMAMLVRLTIGYKKL